MQFDQFLNECQSDPCAFVRPGVDALDAMKAFEHPLEMLLGNSHAPVSRTCNSTAPSTGFSVSATSPSNVNFKALESRFKTTFSHISRSTYTGSAIGWHSTEKRSPAFSIAESNALAISDVKLAKSVG